MKYNVENLKSFERKWNNLPTKVIRIPTIFEDDIYSISQKMDKGKYVKSEEIMSDLKVLLDKINNNEKDYRTISKRIKNDIEEIYKRYSEEN